VGLPLTLGFVAEDLLVQGSVQEFPALGFALIVATALNGVSVMRAFFTLFSGSSKHIGECDLTPRESGVITLVMALLLLTGLFPGFTVRGLQRVTDAQQTKPPIVQASFTADLQMSTQHQKEIR
jgi:NADH-quinone oxidoreductase subunit M